MESSKKVTQRLGFLKRPIRAVKYANPVIFGARGKDNDKAARNLSTVPHAPQ